METEYLKIEDLEEGKLYHVEGRNLYHVEGMNFDLGMWKKLENGWKTHGFVYMREKFGHQFLDVEYHHDEGHPYGTAKPVAPYEGEDPKWLEDALNYKEGQ